MQQSTYEKFLLIEFRMKKDTFYKNFEFLYESKIFCYSKVKSILILVLFLFNN